MNVKYSATKYPTKKKRLQNSLQGIFALCHGKEENASTLFCLEAKFFYLQKLPSGMTPFCILDVNLFFTVLSRANPKDKKIKVKNSGLPRARKSSLNDSTCILQIHRKQIKWCQHWLLNEAG